MPKLKEGALEATLMAMQQRQDTMHEQNTRIFTRIVDKLDLLPVMQKDIAVMGTTMNNVNEKLLTHMKDDDEWFEKFDERFEKNENQIEDLKKDSWIRKGASAALGAIAGFGASLLHK
jgi:hypothetical protein